MFKQNAIQYIGHDEVRLAIIKGAYFANLFEVYILADDYVHMTKTYDIIGP